LASGPHKALLSAYIETRADLRAYFLVRLRSDTDADDLVQELYEKVAAVDARLEIEQPLAFLYRQASNLMLDRLRSRKRTAGRDAEWRRTHHIAGDSEDIADEPSAYDVVAGRERLARLVEAIKALPGPIQTVFRMHKFEGLAHKEVAERLGISKSLVEKHMIAALRHLTETVRDAD
jgi:RNA polymerase sigma factor (sigma-70 family)